jgi:hypothetical protein
MTDYLDEAVIAEARISSDSQLAGSSTELKSRTLALPLVPSDGTVDYFTGTCTLSASLFAVFDVSAEGLGKPSMIECTRTIHSSAEVMTAGKVLTLAFLQLRASTASVLSHSPVVNDILEMSKLVRHLEQT